MANAPVSFVCYAREDAEFALHLAKDLKAVGAIVWLDVIDIVPGQRWDRAVEKALRAASQLLVIVSPASVESENVMDEIALALEEGKTIIPVLHRDCTIPFRLRRMQYIDFRTEYESRLEELLRSLHVDKATFYRKPTCLSPQHTILGWLTWLQKTVRLRTGDRMGQDDHRLRAFSSCLLDGLLDMLDEANCALFLVGHQETPNQGEGATVGVESIFELGLMLGRFGRERSFLIVPVDQREVLLPRTSDGMIRRATMRRRTVTELPAALRSACDQVRQALRKLNRHPLGARTESESVTEPLPALSEAQKKHLSNLAQGKTIGYEGRGSLRSELRDSSGWSLGEITRAEYRRSGDWHNSQPCRCRETYGRRQTVDRANGIGAVREVYAEPEVQMGATAHLQIEPRAVFRLPSPGPTFTLMQPIQLTAVGRLE